MTINKELLFNLIKKLESGELDIYIGENWHENKGEVGGLYLKDTKTKEEIYLVNAWTKHDDFFCERVNKEWERVNDKFKENFYKEKGLDKCWVKECSNKIYQTEIDYWKRKAYILANKNRLCYQHEIRANEKNFSNSGLNFEDYIKHGVDCMECDAGNIKEPTIEEIISK